MQLVVVNNIPTPYRVHLFTALDDACRRRGIGFEAWFMAASEPGRYWRFDPELFGFESRRFAGLHPRVGPGVLHANPAMVPALLKRRPDWLVVAGSWAMPSTLALLASAKACRLPTRCLIWTEANAASIGHRGGLYGKVRGWVYETADGLVIPGRVAQETIVTTLLLAPRRFVYLPNIVDERVFDAAVAAARSRRAALRETLGAAEGDIVVALVARLQEHTKGLVNFLSAVAPIWPANLVVAIAGEGPDRARIEQWAHEHPNLRLRLLGHLDQPHLVDLLAAADAAATPSFRDHNPLSVIEALWAGLPVIVSRACGNWPEAIADGKNGWLVDPHDHDTIRSAMLHLLASSADSRTEMGRHSRRIAEDTFATRTVVDRFLNQLQAMER